MPNPVRVSDIERRFRPLKEQEVVNAEAWLADIWSLLLQKRKTIEAEILAGDVQESTLVRVLSESVIRKLRNPDGKAEESIDDYRFKRDAAVASGELYLTRDELTELTPTSTGRRHSVRLVVP